MTLEDRLHTWLSQPGASLSAAEFKFIQDMREASAHGVGYGFMQQVTEWEWESKHPGSSWGPEYHMGRIHDLERKILELKGSLK